MSRFAAAAAIGLIGVALATVETGVSASPRSAALCTPATNIEAIVDDSGSMAGTDPDRLRVAALKMLIDKPADATKTLGAIEFGTGADPIFTPQRMGTAGGGMKAALGSRIDYGDGLTNYNTAFSLARQQNPNAGAQIFLTDGAHNVGKYGDGHRGGPRTYVIGLGIGPPGADASANRLQKIATDTGGKYYANVNAAALPAIVNDIDAKLSCLAEPRRLQDTFGRAGRQAAHLVETGGGVEITSSWSSRSDAFRIVLPARAGMKVTRVSGATYEIVRVSGLRPGTLRFAVQARRLAGRARVTTQIS